MAPSTTTSATTDKLNFNVAKKICSSAEIERMACAFLHHEDMWKFDTVAAAADFGTGDVKPESFKRVISNSVKKIRETMAKGIDLEIAKGDAAPATTKGKGKGKPKRKAAEMEKAGAGEETARKQKKVKGVKKGKKDSASPDAGAEWTAINGGEGEKGETLVKAEEGEHELA